MKAYADLADLPEDDRIEAIARAAANCVVGFVVDDDRKADRYIEKLKAYPVRLIDRKPLNLYRGATTVLVRVGPKES